VVVGESTEQWDRFRTYVCFRHIPDAIPSPLRGEGMGEPTFGFLAWVGVCGGRPLTRLGLRPIHPLPQGEREGSEINPPTEPPFSP
jgi:hypothetical protein